MKEKCYKMKSETSTDMSEKEQDEVYTWREEGI